MRSRVHWRVGAGTGDVSGRLFSEQLSSVARGKVDKSSKIKPKQGAEKH